MTSTILEEVMQRHRDREGPLLPILHDVQAAQGWISEADIIAIAADLNLSRAEVSGVVSFYHDFRRAPPDRPRIRVCRAEACQARGVDALLAQHMDARVEVEAVYCLGLCSVGPAALCARGEVHARLTPERLASLIEDAAG